jgi:hypothetical protein
VIREAAASRPRAIAIASAQPSGRRYLVERLKRREDPAALRVLVVAELQRRSAAVKKLGRYDFMDETEVAEIDKLDSR